METEKFYVYQAEFEHNKRVDSYIAIATNWREARKLIIDKVTSELPADYSVRCEAGIRLKDEIPIERGFLFGFDRGL